MKAADLPLYYNMCEILEHNLKARADKTALNSNDGSLTFGEVSSQVNQIGNALLRSGIQFGDCVAILCPDRPEWVSSFFAVAKIGGIALAMNTLLKPEEHDYILGDSRARVLMVHESLLDVIAPTFENHKSLEHVIVIGDSGDASYTTFDDWIVGEVDTLDAERTHRDDFCSLHYSSGTTGMPKGILHAHKDYPLIAQLSGVNLFGLTEDDRTFSVAKLFFVYGIGANLIFPWYVGASCVLHAGPPRQVAAVLKTIETFKPTIFVSVPTVYAAILALPDFNERYNLSSIRMCMSAGEVLPVSTWKAWKEGTELEILDTIGCTETCHTFMSNRPGEIRPGSSGKPIGGYDVRLVDDDGNDVLTDEVGNLMVRGESTALSYLHQYEKSRHTFRGEWLFTGDQYVMDKDGYYWHQGRVDDMLKVGGLWVSPTEVENALGDHDGVAECAVVGQYDDAGLIKPKAFVCLREDVVQSDELLGELLKLCASKLDAHKRPRWVIFVEHLPRTATGKLQRFKLREH
ncbi:MAG: benzoate-CoA ligase family protein [Alphaproteobacteria bacterium]|nr:benzoate-CoA ligase family protein [Alphaproteobacteria bacterium]